MPYPAILLLLLTNVKIFTCQESAQYLRNVIRDLKQIKNESKSRRIVFAESNPLTESASPQPYMNRRVQQENGIPELSLTKEELASLYENAVSKGHTVQLDTGEDSFVNAAIHELDDSGLIKQNHNDEESLDHGDANGYYYYYYPIKSFFEDITSQPDGEHHNHKKPSYDVVHVKKPKLNQNYNYHKHTHEHNVKITTKSPSKDDHKKNKLEPLFMAITGFLGMAVMFVLSVLVFPKFGLKSPKPKGKNDLGDLARIALAAIEGKDCTERFACELGKTARSMNLHENRFIKLFWNLAPTSLSKKFNTFYTFTNKQMKCTAIPCKKKQPVAKNNPKNKKKTKKS